MNCPTCNRKNAEVFSGIIRISHMTRETAQMLRDLNSGKLKWSREYREKVIPLITGKSMPNTLANFCGGCGTDLRPYHEEIMKHSDLKPLPDVVFI